MPNRFYMVHPEPFHKSKMKHSGTLLRMCFDQITEGFFEEKRLTRVRMGNLVKIKHLKVMVNSYHNYLKYCS